MFFHLFDFTFVNVRILHCMNGKENSELYRFMEKMAEGLVSDTGIQTKEHSQ